MWPARVVLLGIALVLVPAHVCANPAVIVAETYFETGLEGWDLYPGPSEQLTWESSGGSADGYARFEDASPVGDFARAPSEFLGDWSFLNGVGFLHWDIGVFGLGHDPVLLEYRAVIAGPGGRAVYNSPGPVGLTDWERVTAHVYEGAWAVEAGTWPGVLAQVETLLIRIEMVGDPEAGPQGDIDGLDTVVLGAPYAWLPPEPVQAMSWAAIKGLWRTF